MRRRAVSLVGGRLGSLVGTSAEQQAAGLATSSGSVSSTGLFGTTSTGRLPCATAAGRLAGQRGKAAAAVPAAAAAVATKLQPDVLPLTRVDEFGAISILESEAEGAFVPQAFENIDGRRIEDGRYAAFARDITGASDA